MSRSYRHHNICAVSCCGYDGSEKKDKQRLNQKMRSKSKQLISLSDPDEFTSNFLPHKNEIENRSTWLKDGKQFIKDPFHCKDSSLHFTRDGKLKR